MRSIIAAVLVLAAAACSENAPTASAPPAPTAESAPAGACAATASIDWAPVAGAAYVISASAAGPACDAGTATLTVKDGAGKVLYSGAHEVEPMTNTIFAEAKTPETLKVALGEWIDPQGSTLRSTRALPDWPRGAEGPVAGEFPFYPEEGMTRDAWLRLRAQDKPLYCFVQGGESMACLALDVAAGTLTRVGVQTFPG